MLDPRLICFGNLINQYLHNNLSYTVYRFHFSLQYKLKDRLQSLLEVGGGKVVSVEDFCIDSQV